MLDAEGAAALVSIVIPVFNGGRWLAEAIDSALAQTWPAVEVIVVNDGSTDGLTERIALSYGDQIRYIPRPHGGVSAALNAGIDAMSGRFFSWLSHDDRYRPGKVERQVRALLAQPGETVAYGEYRLIDDSGLPTDRSSLLDRVDQKDEPVWLVLMGWLSGCTLMVPKTCLDVVGGFDEGLPDTQDYDLWFRLAKQFPFLLVPSHDVESRRHPAQGSRQRQHGAQVASLWRDILDDLSDDDLCRLGGTLEGFFDRVADSPTLKINPAVSALVERRRGTSLESLHGPPRPDPERVNAPPEPGVASGFRQPSIAGPVDAVGFHETALKRNVRRFLVQPRVLRGLLGLGETVAGLGGVRAGAFVSHYTKSLLHLHGRIDDEFYRNRYGRRERWNDVTLHYLRHGRHRGWIPHPDFDLERFRRLFPESCGSHLEPLSWLGVHRPDLVDRPLGEILRRELPPALEECRGEGRPFVLYLYSSGNDLAGYWARRLVDSRCDAGALLASVDEADILKLSRPGREDAGAVVILAEDAGKLARALKEAGLVQATGVGAMPDRPVLSGFLDALAIPLVMVVTDRESFLRPWGRTPRPRPPRDAGRCDRLLTPHASLAAELGEDFPRLDLCHAEVNEVPDPRRHRVRIPRHRYDRALHVVVMEDSDRTMRTVAEVVAERGTGSMVEFACVAAAGSPGNALDETVRDLRPWARSDLTYALCAWETDIAWLPRALTPADHLLMVTVLRHGLPIATIDTPYTRSVLEGRPASWLLPDEACGADWLELFVGLRNEGADWERAGAQGREPIITSLLYAEPATAQ